MNAEEARRIINHSPLFLDENSPDYEAVSALLEMASEMGSYTAAAAGTVLGKAIGIRQERNRRKKAPARLELDGMSLDVIRKLDIGDHELMSSEVVELVKYGNQFGANGWFYMLMAVYKFSFLRGQEAPKGSVMYRLPVMSAGR